MIDTTRIRTGFNVELLLGAGWFRTALQGLADIGRCWVMTRLHLRRQTRRS